MKAVIALTCFSLLACCAPALAQHSPKLYTDTHGTYYLEYVWTSDPQIGSGWQKRYVKEFVDFDEPANVVGVAHGSSEPITKPLGDPPVMNEADRQAAIAKADKRGAEIDRTLGVNDYRFGEAGGPAAATAFAFGVATELATDHARAQRIERLRQEVQALNETLQNQAKTYADEGASFAAAISGRGATLNEALESVAKLPPISAVNPGLPRTKAIFLYTTRNPFFALRLSRLEARIASGSQRLPNDLQETGIAAIRLADVENARGHLSTAESFIQIAKVVADVGLGLDPITGTARGLYELITGKNLVTGAALSSFERGLSLFNVVTLGGFGTVEEATRGVAMLGHVLGGVHLSAVNSAITSFRKFFRATIIDRLLSFHYGGKAVLDEGTILLDKAKPLVAAKFPSDGWFARVLPRDIATKVVDGARLSKEDMAFVTAAEDLKGIESKAGLAKRLSLFENPEATRLRALEDHVVVEFKFTPPNDPVLSTPIGNAGEWGNGWIPGGFTEGNAREWLVDSNAFPNGLIDRKSVRLREIPKP